MFERIIQFLQIDQRHEEVSALSLGIFRAFFGIILFVEAYTRFRVIGDYYTDVDILIKWQSLQWIPEFGSEIYTMTAIVMMASAIFISVGLLTRFFQIVYLLGYVYFFVLDASYYNNHYYLIILLQIFMLFTGINRAFSLDRYLFKTLKKTIPLWHILIYRFQIVLVYCIAGLVKLNPEWISGNTMRTVYRYGTDYENLKSYLNEDVFTYFFTYSGVIFDLLIGFMLLSKRTRIPAIIAIVLFHIVNLASLNIGVFPVMMIGATILFFQPHLLTKYRVIVTQKINGKRKYVDMALVIFFILQIVLPARHHFIPGKVDWTGEANNFAWRMKTTIKRTANFEIFCYNKYTGEEYKPEISFAKHQYASLLINPVRILQVADHIQSQVGVSRDSLEIFAHVHVLFNGREATELIDSKMNLLEQQYNPIGHNQFITLAPGGFLKEN